MPYIYIIYLYSSFLFYKNYSNFICFNPSFLLKCLPCLYLPFQVGIKDSSSWWIAERFWLTSTSTILILCLLAVLLARLVSRCQIMSWRLTPLFKKTSLCFCPVGIYQRESEKLQFSCRVFGQTKHSCLFCACKSSMLRSLFADWIVVCECRYHTWTDAR